MLSVIFKRFGSFKRFWQECNQTPDGKDDPGEALLFTPRCAHLHGEQCQVFLGQEVNTGGSRELQ